MQFLEATIQTKNKITCYKHMELTEYLYQKLSKQKKKETEFHKATSNISGHWCICFCFPIAK